MPAHTRESIGAHIIIQMYNHGTLAQWVSIIIIEVKLRSMPQVKHFFDRISKYVHLAAILNFAYIISNASYHCYNLDLESV